MIWFLLYLTVIGVVAGIIAVVGIVLIARVFGRRFWRPAAVALLIAAGTVPPTLLAVFWYARTVDYAWAIRGPGPFAQLGGGPAMMFAFMMTALLMGSCWLSALWIAARGLPARISGRREA